MALRVDIIALLLLAPLCTITRAAEPCAPLERTDVAALFDGWNLSLASLDADTVTQRYWDDAVLLATVSNTPRTSAAMIRDYFVHFLEKRPRGRIDSRSVQVGCNLALDMGTYTFSVMSGSGAVSEVAARYTFVYAWRNGEWRIAHHHSSAMPETPGSAPVAPEPAHSQAATAPGKVAKKDAGSESGRKLGALPAQDGSRLFLNTESSPQVMEFYPAEARARRVAGKVALRVCADPSGTLTGEPRVLRSSGHDGLDAAARRWAQAAKWVPATSNQRSVEGCAEVTAAFRP